MTRRLYISAGVQYQEWVRGLAARDWPLGCSWHTFQTPRSDEERGMQWRIRLTEVCLAEVVLLVVERGDLMRFVELGAALAAGRQVHAVGLGAASVGHHPLVTHHTDVERALEACRVALV